MPEIERVHELRKLAMRPKRSVCRSGDLQCASGYANATPPQENIIEANGLAKALGSDKTRKAAINSKRGARIYLQRFAEDAKA